MNTTQKFQTTPFSSIRPLFGFGQTRLLNLIFFSNVARYCVYVFGIWVCVGLGEPLRRVVTPRGLQSCRRRSRGTRTQRDATGLRWPCPSGRLPLHWGAAWWGLLQAGSKTAQLVQWYDTHWKVPAFNLRADSNLYS